MFGILDWKQLAMPAETLNPASQQLIRDMRSFRDGGAHVQTELAQIYRKPMVVSRRNELHADRNKHKKLGTFFLGQRCWRELMARSGTTEKEKKTCRNLALEDNATQANRY